MPSYSIIITLLCLVSSLGRFTLDSYLPSMPSIGDYFGVSSAGAQYTLSTYLLGFGLSQLIYGPLSDFYGRRRIMLVGLGIFILGNIACVFAPTHLMLLVARTIAGVGAGACGVLNRAIASDCFQGADFSKAWSYTTTTLVLTLCFAPVIGGYAEEYYGWRANFALSTVFVAVVLLLIAKFLPETHKQPLQLENSKLRFTQIMSDYYKILVTPSFLAGTLCYTLSFAGVIAYFQVTPALFIDFFGLTPSQYGLCSIVIAGNYLLGGYIVNRYVKKVGTQMLLKIGTLLLILGGVTMLLLNVLHFHSVLTILAASSIYIIGARIIIPNAIADSMKELRHLGGSSSALIGSIQMLGSSMVSLLIARFATSPQLMLAMAFIFLGGMTLTVFLWGSSWQS